MVSINIDILVIHFKYGFNFGGFHQIDPHVDIYDTGHTPMFKTHKQYWCRLEEQCCGFE